MVNNKSVGIWIRVSTEDQAKGESPEHHERRARLYAESKGWTVAEVYHMEAVSGKTVMDHPNTKRMLSDIRSKKISGLIFSKLARLARNTKELLDFADLFRDNNADLISLQESIDTSTPAGRLFYTVIAAMAQWEREEISSRVAASVPVRASLGKPLGGQASFGYKWEGKELQIDEQEGPIRKMIYEEFAKHKRKKATATSLNNLGYRTRSGSKFSDTTIHRLLRDSTAKGVRIANYTKSLGEGKKWELKPETDWIKIPCPALVSEELWDTCNQILDLQEKKRMPTGPKPVYLLSGFIICECGKKMYVTSKAPVFKCHSCSISIRSEDIDEIYHDELKSFLLAESDVSTYIMKSNSMIEEREELLKITTTELATIRKRADELVSMKLGGDIDSIQFKHYFHPIQERIAQIEDQLPELQAELDYLKIQSVSSETILDDARNLHQNWTSMSFEDKRNVIELITSQIIVGKEDISITLSSLPFQNQQKRQHNLIPALPFYNYTNTVKRKWRKDYPDTAQTIGDQIKRKRYDLRLLQNEVASIFGVSEDTIRNWETGKSYPQLNFYPKIISFLGFNPFHEDLNSDKDQEFKDQIYRFRRLRGINCEELGKMLGVHPTTVWSWEKGYSMPSKKAQKEILNQITEVANSKSKSTNRL